MQTQIDLVKLKFDKAPKNNNRYRLQIKLDDIAFVSAQNICVNGTVWLLQKTTIFKRNVKHDQFIKFQIFEGHQQVGHSIMFVRQLNKKIQLLHPKINKKIDILSRQHGKIELQFHFGEHFYEPGRGRIPTQEQQIEYEEALLSIFSNKKLEFFKLSSFCFKFGHRLDYIAKLFIVFFNIILWKDPKITFTFGIVASLAILNIRLSLMLLAFGLISLQRIASLSSNKFQLINASDRIIFPKQTLLFVQEVMEFYVAKYDEFFNAIMNEDRSVIVNLLDQLSLIVIYMALALLIIDLQQLAVISLWITLLLTSSYGGIVKNSLISILIYNKKLFNIFTEGISSKTNTLIKLQVSQCHLIKQFYMFQYQRWYISNQWMHPEKNKWSSQQWKVDLIPRKYPPEGWIWLDGWHFFVNEQTDNEGYQYSNNFNITFQKQLNLKTIRRRKWIRRCVIQSQFMAKKQQNQNGDQSPTKDLNARKTQLLIKKD